MILRLDTEQWDCRRQLSYTGASPILANGRHREAPSEPGAFTQRSPRHAPCLASASRPSIQDLEHRKERLETQLERAEEARNIKRFFLGSTVWGILSIYALVWLSNISHPEWALATTIIIGSIAGFLSFLISLMAYGSEAVS